MRKLLELLFQVELLHQRIIFAIEMNHNIEHIDILNNCPDPIISINRNGVIIYKNISSLDFASKISRNNIIYKKYLGYINSAIDNNQARIEFKISNINFRSILRYDNKSNLIFIYSRDITHRYNYEKERSDVIQFDQSQHKVKGSCSVNYKGQFWIFGGYYDSRKVSTVHNCGLKTTSAELQEIGIHY